MLVEPNSDADDDNDDAWLIDFITATFPAVLTQVDVFIIMVIIFITWLAVWGIVVFLIKTCNMNRAHEALYIDVNVVQHHVVLSCWSNALVLCLFTIPLWCAELTSWFVSLSVDDLHFTQCKER